MPTIITMPAFSSTMETGKLIKWLVNEGDRISSGQSLAEVETDKAVADIEATTDGYLAKILITDPDTDIPVNETMAIILGENENPDELDQYITPKRKSTETSSFSSGQEPKNPQSSKTRSEVKTSPGARRVADEAGIDITQVKGTGPKDRITKDDVVRFISDSGLDISAQSEPAKEAKRPFSDQGSGTQSVNLSPMRSAIAQRLTESKQNIPHFYIDIDINLDNLIKKRSDAINSGNKKTSLNIFFVKACALAMKDVPQINTSWNENSIICNSYFNIGLAVGIDDGLVVPVIKDVDTKTISQLAEESRDLIKLARDKQLPQSKLGNSSITISNLGMYNIKRFYAIINPPESCILALGAVGRQPVIINDGIHVCNIMTCTMSADHRLIDGVTAAKYLNSFKYFLENPSDWIAT